MSALYNQLLVPYASNAITGNQTTEDNALQGGAIPTQTLWQVVIDDVISRVNVTKFPVGATTYRVERGINYLPPSAGGAKPNLLVPVLDGVGAVAKDATNDRDSDLSYHNVAVNLTRYSRTFGLNMYDVYKGDDHTAEYIAGCIEAIMQELHTDMCNTLATSANTVDMGEVTPANVAHKVSAAFGVKGDVEYMALTPADYAMLLPTDRNGFAVSEGVYGIGKIYKSALPVGVDGLAWSKDGIAAAFASAAYGDMPGVMFQTIDVEGIPFRVKIWADPATNEIFHTVDVLAGFALANTDHVAVLDKGEDPGS